MAVNAAGNYTKPGMRKTLFKRIKAANVQGTAAGKWSLVRRSYLLRDTRQLGVDTNEGSSKVAS
jgi:hypothetical protein